MNIFYNIVNIINIVLSVLSPNLRDAQRKNEQTVMVVDTSTILNSDAEVFYKFKKESIVVIPPIVIAELHHISKKNSNSILKQNAQYALNELRYFFKRGELTSGAKLVVPQILKTSFHPNTVDVNDRKILKRAIKYSKLGYSVCLVTQDNKLTIMARNSGLKTKAYPFK